MSDTFSNEPSATPDGMEQESEQREKGKPETGISYSWVNPKLKNTEDEGIPSDPWGGDNPNVWRASQDTSRSAYEYRQETGSTMEKPEETTEKANRASRRAAKKVSRKESGKRPMGTGKRWATTVAMAVVFGLVAGLVFNGVTGVGRKMSEPERTKIEIAATAPATGEEQEKGEIFSENAMPVVTGGTVADVAAQCMPSLVTISTISVEEMRSFFGQTQQYEVAGAGTGVIVGQNDTELLIATNNHVVTGAKSLSVGFIDETAVSGAIKGYDSSTDLAVVAVKLSDIPGETMEQIKICEMGNSDELVLGEQVVAIGNALGYGQSVTSGYISAFNRELGLTDNSGHSFTSTGLIQTDASINSGNSGGALLNMRGQLIGINEAKSSGSSSSASVDNIGFAIPISKAEPILENLMTLTTRDKVSEKQASYIGITCADVSEETARMYSMPTGVCLTSIMEGSPAEAAGLKKGDILIRFDGRELSTYAELTNILQYYAAGETVELTVQRSDEGEYTERVITLTLGSASDMPSSYQSGGNEEHHQEETHP